MKIVIVKGHLPPGDLAPAGPLSGLTEQPQTRLERAMRRIYDELGQEMQAANASFSSQYQVVPFGSESFAALKEDLADKIPAAIARENVQFFGGRTGPEGWSDAAKVYANQIAAQDQQNAPFILGRADQYEKELQAAEEGISPWAVAGLGLGLAGVAWGLTRLFR